MIDDAPIYTLFLDYEQDKKGMLSNDFEGNPILQSELNWLNRFLCEESEGNFNPNYNTQLFINDLQSNLWQTFVIFIYENAGENKAEVGKIIKRILSFLKWLGNTHSYSKTELEILVSSLKFEQKKIDRLLKIYKHLSSLLNSRIYVPEPTENLEHLELNEAFFKAQLPKITRKFIDDFKIVSINKNNATVYLKSLTNSDPIVLSLDSVLLKAVAVGDIYPLTIGLDDDGNSVLLDYAYPTIVK
jgi:hypothetical protein